MTCPGRELLNIKHLDGLRGIAVLLVILSHYSNIGYFSDYVDFSGAGKVGVYLFFVLSAYLLTSGSLAKGSDFLSVSGLRYYISRRVMRIYPLYFAVVFLSVITTEFFSAYLYGQGFPYKIDINSGFWHLLLQRGDYVLWSIPVEFKYYFLIPFLVLFLGLIPRHVSLVLLVFIITISYSVFDYVNNSVSLAPYVCVFFMGSFYAFLERNFQLYFIDFGYASILIFVLGVLAFVPSIYIYFGVDMSVRFFHSYTLVIAGYWVFILYVSSGSECLRKVLNFSIFRELGKISFSVYLLHIPAMQGVKLIFGVGGWQFLFTVFLIAAASYSSYYLIERKFM